MEQFLREVRSNIDELESMNVTLPEELTVLLILRSLPKEYQFFTKVLYGKDSLPSFCELELKLLDEELQVKMDAEKDNTSEALYLNRGSTSRYRGGYNGTTPPRHLNNNLPRQPLSRTHRSVAKPRTPSSAPTQYHISITYYGAD